MNAQEIRALGMKYTHKEFGGMMSASDSDRLDLLVLLVQEIAAQLAELNENKRVTVRYAGNYGGEPEIDRWQCPTCHLIVYSEDHLKLHLNDHEESDKKTGGAQ